MTDLQQKLELVFKLKAREWDESDADSPEARSARAYNSALATVWGILKGVNPSDPETIAQKHDRIMAELNDLKRADTSLAVAHLGLATTKELLDEITTRIEIDWYSGGGGLGYTTILGRPDDAVPAPTRFGSPSGVTEETVKDVVPDIKEEGEDG